MRFCFLSMTDFHPFHLQDTQHPKIFSFNLFFLSFSIDIIRYWLRCSDDFFPFFLVSLFNVCLSAHADQWNSISVNRTFDCQLTEPNEKKNSRASCLIKMSALTSLSLSVNDRSCPIIDKGKNRQRWNERKKDMRNREREKETY